MLFFEWHHALKLGTIPYEACNEKIIFNVFGSIILYDPSFVSFGCTESTKRMEKLLYSLGDSSLARTKF
jgi:hypothetical protein